MYVIARSVLIPSFSLLQVRSLYFSLINFAILRCRTPLAHDTGYTTAPVADSTQTLR